MYVVVIHHHDATAELAETLAAVMQVTVFDARQRLVGKGPTVVASYADPGQAQSLLGKLRQAGFEGFVVDAERCLAGSATIVVRRFELAEDAFCVEAAGGRKVRMAYHDVALLIPASRSTSQTEIQAVTDRKFSMGKTLLAGGLPMTKKVTLQETVTLEDQERILYLCAKDRRRLLFCQNGMNYDGLGKEMKFSRDMNFQCLLAELYRRCPTTARDDRLLNRAGQARLLGPLLRPEANLELAVEILAIEAGASQA
jgi:hypothetical protein